MVKRLATSIGVLLLTSSFAFAAQNSGAQSAAQGPTVKAPSTTSATKTPTKAAKHHKKHHKHAKKAATTTTQSAK